MRELYEKADEQVRNLKDSPWPGDGKSIAKTYLERKEARAKEGRHHGRKGRG